MVHGDLRWRKPRRMRGGEACKVKYREKHKTTIIMVDGRILQSLRGACHVDHVSRRMWVSLVAMTVVLVIAALSVGSYCGRDTGRCSCGDELEEGYECWPVTIWKDFGWDNGCEEYLQSDFMRNPVNALSNIGFVVVGLWVLGIALEDFRFGKIRKPADNLIVANPILSLMFSFCFTWCGVGSFLFHASIDTFPNSVSRGEDVQDATNLFCRVHSVWHDRRGRGTVHAHVGDKLGKQFCNCSRCRRRRLLPLARLNTNARANATQPFFVGQCPFGDADLLWISIDRYCELGMQADERLPGPRCVACRRVSLHLPVLPLPESRTQLHEERGGGGLGGETNAARRGER